MKAQKPALKLAAAKARLAHERQLLAQQIAWANRNQSTSATVTQRRR